MSYVFPSSFLFCKCSAHSILAVLHNQYLHCHPFSRFSSFRKTDLSLGFTLLCGCSFVVLYDSTLLPLLVLVLSSVLHVLICCHCPFQRFLSRFGCAFPLGLADTCLLAVSAQRPPSSSPCQFRALPDPSYFYFSSQLLYLG